MKRNENSRAYCSTTIASKQEAIDFRKKIIKLGNANRVKRTFRYDIERFRDINPIKCVGSLPTLNYITNLILPILKLTNKNL